MLQPVRQTGVCPALTECELSIPKHYTKSNFESLFLLENDRLLGDLRQQIDCFGVHYDPRRVCGDGFDLNVLI